MSKARKTLSDLSKDMDRGLRVFASNLTQQLKVKTPIRSGFARNSWKNIYSGKSLGHGGVIPLAKNDASYIGVLDGQSPKGFTSRQAPQGIVKPAVKQTRKK